jgi:hypothetical protein
MLTLPLPIKSSLFQHPETDPSCPLLRRPLTEKVRKRLAKDKEAEEYYQSLGLHVNIVYECVWKKRRESDPRIRDFLQSHVHLPYNRQRRMVKDKMRALIMDQQIFGLVEFEAHIEEAHRSKYLDNLPPFFRKVEVDVASLSPIQQRQCQLADIR